MAAAMTDADEAMGPAHGTHASCVLAALRASRAAAHAASGLAWRHGFASEARLARSAEAALDVGIAGLLADGEPFGRGQRRRRARGGRGGVARANGSLSDSSLARDTLGGGCTEMPIGQEDGCAEYYRVLTTAAEVQTAPLRGPASPGRSVGTITSRPLRVSRAVQTQASPAALQPQAAEELAPSIETKDPAEPSLVRVLRPTLSDPSTAVPDDCGASELTDDEVWLGPAAMGEALPLLGGQQLGLPATRFETPEETTGADEDAASIAEIAVWPPPPPAEKAGKVAAVAPAPTSAPGILADSSAGEALPTRLGHHALAFIKSARTTTGRASFTSRVHSSFEYMEFQKAEVHGFLLVKACCAACCGCDADIPDGDLFYRQTYPNVTYYCKGCYLARMK